MAPCLLLFCGGSSCAVPHGTSQANDHDVATLLMIMLLFIVVEVFFSATGDLTSFRTNQQRHGVLTIIVASVSFS